MPSSPPAPKRDAPQPGEPTTHPTSSVEAARERFALLTRVSSIMASAGDQESRFSELVRLLVPTLGDASTLCVLGPGGTIRRLTDATASPAIAERVRRARAMPVPTELKPLLQRMFETCRPLHFADYRAEVLARLPPEDPYVEAMREVDIGAAVLAPLCVQGRALGYFTLSMIGSGRTFTPEDLALIEAIAERAALAIEGASLLREAETQRTRLHEAFQQAPVAIAILRGPAHVFELANAVCVRDFGGREVLGKPIREAAPELEGQGFFERLDEVYATGKPFHGAEMPVDFGPRGGGGGESTYHDVIYQPMRGASGEVEGIISLAFDVTERVRARKREAALTDEVRRSEERFRVAFEQAAVGVSLVGPDGRWLYANQKLQEILGYSLEELRAMRFADLTHPDDIGPSQDYVARLVAGELSSFTSEKRYVCKNGYVVWAKISSALVRKASGEPDHFVTILEDISARKEAEAERALFQALVETSGDFIGFATLEGQILYINSAGRALVGLGTQEEARTKTMSDYLAPESIAAGSQAMRANVLGGHTWAGEVLYRNLQTGEVIPVHKTSIAIPGEGGAPRAVAIVARDLRVQKQLEAERQRLLAREREARAAAEEANELKDRFLATVSHELRTPLNAMLGWMRMLRSGQLPPERRERALETVERNAKAQAQLVEDLLDISRMMSGKLRIEVHPLPLLEVVETALETVRPAADAKQIELVPLLEASGATILGDAARLQQVIWNLLSNGIKFTPKGGRVQILVERVGSSSVEIAVKDTGQGIAPDFLPHVFEPFRQADGSTTRMHGGLGLGLAIVKSLVELHGGTIRALSEGAGKGATFVVRLPLAPARENRVETRTTPAVELEAGEMECPPEIQGLRMVVVDDEADARELLVALLERCGAEVRAAASVAEALEAFEAVRPDLLVADIGMPGEDGYALIRKIRSRRPEEGGRTPVVALTAYARTEDRTRALRAGFNMHVSKPIDAAELLAVIASIVPQSGRKMS